MRNLIVFGVLLLLAITVLQTDGVLPKFGDIMAVNRCVCGGIKYSHYLVYVGKGLNPKLPEKTVEQDIFQRIGFVGGAKWKSEFATMNPLEPYQKLNYLDGVKGFKPGSDTDIVDRINEQLKCCGAYHLTQNNCEHLATSVRYGTGISLQLGGTAEGLCKSDPIIPNEIVEELSKQYGQEIGPDAPCTSVCPKSSKKSSP